jgi:hypothetical protein
VERGRAFGSGDSTLPDKCGAAKSDSSGSDAVPRTHSVWPVPFMPRSLKVLQRLNALAFHPSIAANERWRTAGMTRQSRPTSTATAKMHT